jgi:hypothetical protein
MSAPPEPPTTPLGDEAAWRAARENARVEVAAALAPRERQCPHCGHRQTRPGRTCESCGNDMIARRSARLPVTKSVLVAGLVAAMAAGLAATLIPDLRRSAADDRRATAERQQRLEAAERRRLTIDVQPRTATGPQRRAAEGVLVYRARLVAAGEVEITADARRRITEGTIRGPVAATSCDPYPISERRAVLERDPATPLGRYECIAFKERVELPDIAGRPRTGLYGTPYWLVLDYRSGAMTYCKITPKAGEGGKLLASVPVPDACRDPLRRP